MAPVPTQYKHGATAPGCRSRATAPAGGLLLCAPFPGSAAPTGPDRGPERFELPRGRFDALLMQSIQADPSVYRRKLRQIRVEGFRVQNRRPRMPWV